MFSYALISGDYGIHVKYNGEHVPDSPSTVYISPHSADAKMCSVHGIRDRGLEVSTYMYNECRMHRDPVVIIYTNYTC